uniref:Uncharacterized protein n=1 Tax=Globodera pallida TaxID=36090 RepID=A0A183CML6_GLOPA
NKLFQIGNATM